MVDESVRSVLVHYLTEVEGCQVEATKDVKTTLDLLHEKTFDVVLVDHILVLYNQDECDELKGKLGNCVLLTTFNKVDEIMEKYGFPRMLKMPFNLEDLHWALSTN